MLHIGTKLLVAQPKWGNGVNEAGACPLINSKMYPFVPRHTQQHKQLLHSDAVILPIIVLVMLARKGNCHTGNRLTGG